MTSSPQRRDRRAVTKQNNFHQNFFSCLLYLGAIPACFDATVVLLCISEQGSPYLRRMDSVASYVLGVVRFVLISGLQDDIYVVQMP